MSALSILGLSACGPSLESDAPSAVAVVPTVQMTAPWKVEWQDPDALAVRLGDSANGVRIQLAADATGRVPGVSPIDRGKTLEVAADGHRWPLVAIGYPEARLQTVAVEVDGPDLVVRFAGPPLDAVTTHPQAPKDPVLTWVRLRPRGETWRIAVTGLATLAIAANGATAGDLGDAVIAGDWGTFRLSTDAPRFGSRFADGGLFFDTRPALEREQPYPKTSLTWTPIPPAAGASPSPHPR
jgi:hypothetical protein